MYTFCVFKPILEKVGANYTASDYQGLIENQRPRGKKDPLHISCQLFLFNEPSLFPEARASLILQWQNLDSPSKKKKKALFGFIYVQIYFKQLHNMWKIAQEGCLKMLFYQKKKR